MIRLQFVLGADFSSRLIAWYGNGYGGYSHVDAVLPDGSLAGARDDVIDPITPGWTGGAIPSGFHIRPPFYEKWKARDVISLPSTTAQEAAWEAWLRQQVGAPYDTGAIWGFALGRQDHDAGHWICSAAQTQALEQASLLPHIVSPPTSQITPNSLRLMVLAIGGKEAPKFQD